MGERNAGRRRAAQGGGDARHDRDRKAGAQRLDFLAATAEHEGSPAFRRTTVWPARTRRTSSALISSCVQRTWPLRLPTATSSASRRARQHRRRHEIVVQDGVGLAQELRGLERQEIGIAGAGADDMGDAHGRQPAAGVVELAQRGAAGAGIVAGQDQAPRDLDQPTPGCGGGRDRRSGR